jgi:hypothetical protein
VLSDDFELHCLRCEYNLKTLSPDGHCPECGTPVRQSLDARANTPYSNRLRGLLKIQSILLACATFELAASPFKNFPYDLAGQNLGTFAWAARMYGDRLTILTTLITGCFILKRLFALTLKTNSSPRAWKTFGLIARVVAPCMVAFLTTIDVVINCDTFAIGPSALILNMGSAGLALFQAVFWTEAILRPLAFACIASPAILLGSLFAKRQGRGPSKLPQFRWGIGLLFLFSALLTAGAVIPGIVSGSRNVWHFYIEYFKQSCDSIMVISLGLSALLLALDSLSLSPQGHRTTSKSAPCSPVDISRMRMIARLTFFQMIVALVQIVTALVTIVIRPESLVLTAILSAIYGTIFVLTEATIVVRLARLLHCENAGPHSFRRILCVRIISALLLMAFFGGVLVGLAGAIEEYISIILCSILTAHFWASQNTITSLSSLSSSHSQDGSPSRRPLCFGLFVLPYYVLMNAGRNLRSPGPVEIITAVKVGTGILMLATAIWVLIGIMMSSFRLRSEINNLRPHETGGASNVDTPKS